MPSLDFVTSCIGSPQNAKKSDYIYFSFLLRTPSFNALIEVYKDLKGLNSYYNYMLSKYPGKVYIVNRLSNNDYYNSVLNAFGVPEHKEIKCFTYNYDYYYFCYDDFPENCKYSFIYTATLEKISPIFAFIDKFFGSLSYQNNEDNFFSYDRYTTQYGSSPTCTKFKVTGRHYRANNKSFIYYPISVSYNITNYADPSDEFSYARNYGDSFRIKNILYSLSLTPFYSSECCLMQCFGITE